MHTRTPAQPDLITVLDGLLAMPDLKTIKIQQANRFITIVVYMPDPEDPHYHTVTLTAYGSMVVVSRVFFFVSDGHPVNPSADRVTFFCADWQAVIDRITQHEKADAIAAKR